MGGGGGGLQQAGLGGDLYTTTTKSGRSSISGRSSNLGHCERNIGLSWKAVDNVMKWVIGECLGTW